MGQAILSRINLPDSIDSLLSIVTLNTKLDGLFSEDEGVKA
jgi:hypothetical protein